MLLEPAPATGVMDFQALPREHLPPRPRSLPTRPKGNTLHTCLWHIPPRMKLGCGPPRKHPDLLPLTSIGTCGRRMGSAWPWRLIRGSAWTETAPYTSHRRGQGTLAHTPAAYCQLEAMIPAMPTCESGKDKGGMGNSGNGYSEKENFCTF